MTDPLLRALDELVPSAAGERGDWEAVLAAAELSQPSASGCWASTLADPAQDACRLHRRCGSGGDHGDAGVRAARPDRQPGRRSNIGLVQQEPAGAARDQEAVPRHGGRCAARDEPARAARRGTPDRLPRRRRTKAGVMDRADAGRRLLLDPRRRRRRLHQPRQRARQWTT